MYPYALSNSIWSVWSLYLSNALRSDFCTSRSPPVVPCQPGKRTTRTIASMSVTIRSTTAGVWSSLSSKNRSVNAALGVLSCNSSSSSFSAWTVSLAILQSSLTKSIEAIRPFLALSHRASSRSLNDLNTGKSPRSLKRFASSFSSCFVLRGSGLLNMFSITSAL